MDTELKSTCVFKMLTELLPLVERKQKGIMSPSLKNIFIQICLLQTVLRIHLLCLPALLSHKKTVCKQVDVHQTDTRNISKVFCGVHKGENHSELRTKDKKWKRLKQMCSHDKNILYLWWEERCTHNPLRESSHGCVFLSSSTPLHFTSTGSAVCQLPALTELLIMWTQTWRAFITLCRCPTLALTITHPLLSH